MSNTNDKNQKIQSSQQFFQKIQKRLKESLKLKKTFSSVAILSIEGEKLSVLQAVKNGNQIRITHCWEGNLEIPTNIDPKVQGELIAKKLRERKIRVSDVIFTIPRSEVMLRQLILPYVQDEGELASMVQFQIGRDLPFRQEDSTIDFSVIGTRDVIEKENEEESKEKKPQKQLELIVAILPTKIVDFYKTLALGAGLNLISLGFQSTGKIAGLSYCGILKSTELSLSLFIDPAGIAEIDIQKNEKLLFSREASLYKEDEVEKEKKQDWIDSVVTETIRCLHSYEQEHQGQIERIYLLENKNHTPEVLEALKNRMDGSGIEVVPFNIFSLLQLTEEGKWDPSKICSSVGIAAEIIQKGKLSIDFIHPKKPALQKKLDIKKTLLISLTAILALILFLGARSHVLNARRAEVDAVKTQVDQLSQKQNIWRQYIVQTLTLREWQKNERLWLDHLAILSSLLPGCEDLYVTGLSTGTRGNIVLSVRARESDIITKLDSQLREAGYILKTPAITPVSARNGYGFQTSFDLTIPSKMQVDLEKLSIPQNRPEDDISLMPPRERDALLKEAAEFSTQEKKRRKK